MPGLSLALFTTHAQRLIPYLPKLRYPNLAVPSPEFLSRALDNIHPASTVSVAATVNYVNYRLREAFSVSHYSFVYFKPNYVFFDIMPIESLTGICY